ncbi:hypothetical protein GGQ69_000867 [Micrococcus sp. TA1]|nr:hypothetical protein [Micrococcus sp. TA1]
MTRFREAQIDIAIILGLFLGMPTTATLLIEWIGL